MLLNDKICYYTANDQLSSTASSSTFVPLIKTSNSATTLPNVSLQVSLSFAICYSCVNKLVFWYSISCNTSSYFSTSQTSAICTYSVLFWSVILHVHLYFICTWPNICKHLLKIISACNVRPASVVDHLLGRWTSGYTPELNWAGYSEQKL